MADDHPGFCFGCDNYFIKSTEKVDMGYDLDIEPDDIDVSDTVTVIWEIA